MTGDLVDAPDADGPDLIVQTALRLLPVPDHGPGFWTVLGAALALESPSQVDEPALAVGPVRRVPLVATPLSDSQGSPAPAADGTGRIPLVAAATAVSPDLALLLVPLTMRRRSNIVLLAVGVAAATLVVVSGVALVRNRTEGGLGTMDAVEQPLALVAAPTAPLEGSHRAAATVRLGAA